MEQAANGDAMGADAVPLDLSVDLDSLNDTELKVENASFFFFGGRGGGGGRLTSVLLFPLLSSMLFAG